MTWSSPPIGAAVVTRVGASAVTREIVHSEWRIVDRWWTAEPFVRLYRDVTIGGRRRDQVSDNEGATWRDVGAFTFEPSDFAVRHA